MWTASTAIRCVKARLGALDAADAPAKAGAHTDPMRKAV